jgi:Sec-independent protein secretion pathway component TatC
MFVGGCVAGAIGLFIILALFTHAVLAWGVFGAFVVLFGTALLLSWIHDRREAKRRQQQIAG